VIPADLIPEVSASKAAQFQNWRWTTEPDGLPVIEDLPESPIASLHACSKSNSLARAALIASAPGVYPHAAGGALRVLEIMAEKDAGPAVAVAKDMIPAIESALAAAEAMGPIAAAKLVGR
jgi:hypothetical protein